MFLCFQTHLVRSETSFPGHLTRKKPRWVSHPSRWTSWFNWRWNQGRHLQADPTLGPSRCFQQHLWWAPKLWARQFFCQLTSLVNLQKRPWQDLQRQIKAGGFFERCLFTFSDGEEAQLEGTCGFLRENVIDPRFLYVLALHFSDQTRDLKINDFRLWLAHLWAKGVTTFVLDQPGKIIFDAFCENQFKITKQKYITEYAAGMSCLQKNKFPLWLTILRSPWQKGTDPHPIFGSMSIFVWSNDHHQYRWQERR